MFRCRLALAMGRAPSEVEQLGAADYDLLVRYWNAEPWGTWRDNVHAAIVAQQLAGLGGRRAKVEDFMLTDPTQRQVQAKSNIIQLFKAIAKKATSKRKSSG